MLGVPTADRDRFKTWSVDIARLLGGASGADEATARRAQRSFDEMRAYFAPLFAARRRSPQADLVSALIAAEGDAVHGEDELLANCIMLMFGGHETTTNLIGNGTLALLACPDERARLAADPALAPAAIEELLRIDSPVQLLGRACLEEMTLGGVVIPAGRGVILLIGAANRDATAFPAPERLDITRKPRQRHLAFGFGGHFCVGAALARLEGEIAICTLLRRFPRLRTRPGTPLEWQPTLGLRGLVSLPVET
jgi:cytochrome P450